MAERGELRETHYGALKEYDKSSQLALSEFNETGETLVAVVSSVETSDIDLLCDEHRPELGMPERALKRFHDTRAGYRTNSAVDRPHNKAYEDCGLEESYKRQLRKDEAKQALREIASRVLRGENITLVCFEEDGKHCHRHYLLERIEDEIDDQSESDFSFVIPKV